MRVHLIGGCMNGKVVEAGSWVSELSFLAHDGPLPLTNKHVAPKSNAIVERDIYVIDTHVICGKVYHFGVLRSAFMTKDKKSHITVVIEALIDDYFK